MKSITLLIASAVALLTLSLSGCDKKTTDDFKKKAADAQKKVEAKGKELKDAAQPKLKELGDKAKQAAKDAEPKLKEMGEKAKDATQNAIEKMKAAASATPTASP